jgi:hypothetical protein
MIKCEFCEETEGIRFFIYDYSKYEIVPRCEYHIPYVYDETTEESYIIFIVSDQLDSLLGVHLEDSIVIEFRLEDYWIEGDVRPGYSGIAIKSLTKADDIWGDPNVDFSPAFARIMTELSGQVTPGPLKPARILFTGRVAYHFYSTLSVRHPVVLFGIGVPNRSGSNRLIFHECSGIHLRRDPPGPSSVNIGMAVIEGLSIEYAGSPSSDFNYHGIIVHRTSNIHGNSLQRFPGHGIHIEGDVQDSSIDNANASLSNFSECVVYGCGLSGVWIKGRDANVCLFSGINSFANGARKNPEDGFGFYDESVLGNTYISCHTRNNLRAGYRAAKFLGIAPNRSLYINCYSEHSAEPVDAHMQEGPSLLDGNAMVISSIGEGGLVDCRGGGVALGTTQNRAQIGTVLGVGGPNQVNVILGDATKRLSGPGIDSQVSRQAILFESKAYGELSRYFLVHDPSNDVHAWGFKHGSPSVQPMTFGFTDHKHSRPGMPVSPLGVLLGRWPDIPAGSAGGPNGPRRVTYADPRYESTLTTQFPKALPGDIVFNSLPNTGDSNFLCWILTFDVENGFSGTKHWRRFGVGMIGDIVGDEVPLYENPNYELVMKHR